MADDDKARELLERFLGKVASGLRTLPKQQVEEIIQELRSHVLDSAGSTLTEARVTAALAALGDPGQIASQYVTQNLFERASITRSPLLVLQSLFHWATLSLRGFCTGVCSLLFYLMGALFIGAAVMKPFRPASVGLWSLNNGDPDNYSYSLSLGIYDRPLQGHELLGWWIVPLGLLLGCMVIVMTYRFNLKAISAFRRDWRLPNLG